MAQGGVVIGLLLARTLSGVVADGRLARRVFCLGGLACALLLLLWRGCRRQAASRQLAYGALLASMAAMLRHNKVLRVRGMLALLMFAVFNIFWSALVLP
jgi:hypothetical protein